MGGVEEMTNTGKQQVLRQTWQALSEIDDVVVRID